MIESMKTEIAGVLSLLDSIQSSIEAIKQEIETLTAAGVQVGSIHFKTDRPDTMFIWEPMKEGRRQYVHVGKDPEKQARKKAEVERWHKREFLQQQLASYERRLSEINYSISSLGGKAERLENDCSSTAKDLGG